MAINHFYIRNLSNHKKFIVSIHRQLSKKKFCIARQRLVSAVTVGGQPLIALDFINDNAKVPK